MHQRCGQPRPWSEREALILGSYPSGCSYAGSFVEACDELGYGCCFTVVVLDPGEYWKESCFGGTQWR